MLMAALHPKRTLAAVFRQTWVCDVAISRVAVVKCKMMPGIMRLVASWPITACYSWILKTASCTLWIFTPATTWKPYILPRESADLRPWSFGTKPEKPNAGTAFPRKASVRFPPIADILDQVGLGLLGGGWRHPRNEAVAVPHFAREGQLHNAHPNNGLIV